MELQTCYQYDEDKYFVDEVLCQKDENGLMLAADAVEQAPDMSLLAANFLKWDGEKWTAEKKPTTPEECAAIGDLPHDKQTPRIYELRQLFDAICEGSKSWRVEQDPDTLAKRVVPIPPKTEKEIYDEAAEKVRMKRDSLIAETDYLLAPDYPIESESLEAVKLYRQALRDVPQQEGFPFEVEWPVKPEVQKA